MFSMGFEVKLMSEEMSLCRLCTSTQLLKDVYKTDGLLLRVTSCIGVKLDPNDGLTSHICEVCEITINNFYNFKRKCIDIDAKLRSTYCTKECMENTLKRNIKLECELLENEFKDSYLESWLEDHSKTEFDERYFVSNSEEIEDTSRKTIVKKEYESTYNGDNAQLSKTKYCKIEKLQCEQCGNLFKTKQILEKHSLTHTGLKLFSCKLCSKQFTRAAHKVVHMRSHMGIKPYTCEICGKSATKRQDLIRHLRIHSDEKKYPCPQCDKRFKRSSDVHAHLRSHTGARPYKCDDCDKCYTSHSGLKKHYRTHSKKESIIK